LVQLDENQNKQDRVEFMTAFSNFLREAVPAGQASPEMVPMLMDMMKFGIGGFKQAQTLLKALLMRHCNRWSRQAPRKPRTRRPILK
jgi:hypothetical protein